VQRIPALDGLRGLAVVAVVVFHAWPDTLPGGWIGVSLFFTLSGYLITTIIIRDHVDGTDSPLDFWRRRGRRLLPAALVTIVWVVVGTAIVDIDSLAAVSRDALAALAYVHNWRAAAAEGGYEAIFDTTLQPLAHMWSLSIEEQVYILWPPLVLLAGVRRALLGGFVIVVVGSALWWGSDNSYYATPVRFGEVLTGAALAAWVVGGRRLLVPRGVVAVAALVLLGWTASLEESASFVSRGALPIISLCSTIVLAYVLAGGLAGPLGWRPMVWLGTRSYAIYLFHWPLLVLLDVPPVVAIAVTLVLAEVSYRLVEWPIRSGRVMAHPFRSLGVASAVVGVAGTLVLWSAPRPVADEVVAAATAAALEEAAVAAPSTEASTTLPTTPPLESTTTMGGTAVAVTTTTVPPTTTAPVDTRILLPSNPTVLVLGDSTGMALEPALQGWVDQLGGVMLARSRTACSPLFSVGLIAVWSSDGVVEYDRSCRAIPEDGTDLVIVIDHGVILFDHYNGLEERWTSLLEPDMRDALDSAYEALVAESAAVGARVVFLTSPQPFMGWEPDAHSGTDPARLAVYRELVEQIAERHDNVHLVHVGEAVDSDADRYPRADSLHLDHDTGAVNVVLDLVAPAFRIDEVS